MKHLTRTTEGCKEITLHFDFEVVPKQSVRKGKDKSGKDVFYKESKNESFEKKVIFFAKKQLDKFKLSGPVYFEAEYAFKIPNSYPESMKKLISCGVKVYKYTKPDLTDNINKGIIDSLAPFIFEGGDQIIALARVEKVYASRSFIRLRFVELPVHSVH